MPLGFKAFIWDEHAPQMPTPAFVSWSLGCICVAAIFWGLFAKSACSAPHQSAHGVRNRLKQIGVGVRRVERAAREIERKAFHLAGLLIPTIYQFLIHHETDENVIAGVCILITATQWAFDITRLKVPAVQQAFLRTWFGSLMREKEYNQLTGGCFFSLGCTLAICIFPPPIAIAGILFLVLGDMSAALVGVSFGGETCTVKLGREGNKSAEGSIAMFCICFVVGMMIFAQVTLCEYAVFLGAVAATLVELYEPFGLNDNLTIPLVSCLALSYGLYRVELCAGTPGAAPV
eukprot:Hpha_TRINITY_DN9762_c0_g1::TRINITY_DN9762_c0_g1_i1::g.10130::m.10130